MRHSVFVFCHIVSRLRRMNLTACADSMWEGPQCPDCCNARELFAERDEQIL
ncbi:MAG: hypothetical protein QOG67_119 [Verrucomicrobiota bacterium]